MTSPVGGKPTQVTNDKYEGVHGKGSRFGQDLNEARVRDILSTEVKSPFAKFIGKLAEQFAEFAGDIAKAIRGEGAKYGVIAGAVDERLGPLDNAITENTKHFQSLSDDINISIEKQKELQRLSEDNLQTIKENREAAERAIEERVAAENTMNNEIATALRKAESAQTSADGKSTIYYGSKTPKSPKNGDTWFKQGSGKSEILVFQSGKWVQKTDWAKVDADLAENKRAVDQAARDVAAAQEKVDNLVNVELPKISEGTAEFNRKLKEETEARERELAEANKALTSAKKDLNSSMSKLETRLKAADKALETSLNSKISNDLGNAKRELTRSMGKLETRLEDADKAINGTRNDLNEQMLSMPGNIFPDPFFGHRIWGGRRQRPGIKLTADGTVNGKYFANDRADAQTGVQFEPGAHYLLTADVEFSGDVTEILVYVVGTKDRATGGTGRHLVARIKKKETSGVVDDIGIVSFKAPETLRSGSTTMGFFTSSKSSNGYAIINNVRLVRAADDSLIIDGAVTANKVQAGAIDTAHLAADAVTAKKIAAGTITAKELGAGSVTAKQILAHSITGDHIASRSITTEELRIAPGNLFPDPEFRDPYWEESGVHSVEARYGRNCLRLNANGKHTGRYYRPRDSEEDNPVRLEPDSWYRLSAWARFSEKTNATGVRVNLRYFTESGSRATFLMGKVLRDSSSWGGSGGTVTAMLKTPKTMDRPDCTIGFWLHSSATEGNVLLSDVQMVRAADANLIVDGSIIADKLAANAVTAKAIESDAIRAKHIKSGEITARELAAGAVTADNIAAGAITGDKISANTITGDNVLANSITSTELQIRPGNLFPDPEFQDPYWSDSKSHNVATEYGRNCLNLKADGTITGRYYRPKDSDEARPMRLEPDSAYRLTCWARFGGTSDIKSVNVLMRYKDATGRERTYKMGEIPRESQVHYGDGGTVSTLLKTPKNMDKPNCTIGFWLSSKYESGSVLLADVQIVRATDASLIVDGAILAKHIKAGEITSNEIAAGTITGKNLKADQITGREIKSGTINANQLTVDNGFIKNAMIADATIEASKIKTLDADKITSGTISGKRIDADSITVRQIRANSIVPIGGSLIHHEPPPEDDTKPPEPIWWQALDEELSESVTSWPRPEGHPWHTSHSHKKSKGWARIPKRLVKVKPGQKYRLGFWCRATGSGSSISMDIRDQNDKYAVKSGAIYRGVKTAIEYKTAKENEKDWGYADFTGTKSGSGYLVSGFTVPKEATYVTTTIEFRDGVEYVYLRGIYFNWGADPGTETNQWIAGLSLELDIPDQAQVDKIQNDAIKALEDAEGLNTDFRKEQIKTNELREAQVWQNRNMIELVDIRSPRLYGWAMKDVKTKKYCPWLPPDWGNYPKPYMECPYFEMYQSGNAVFIGFKGKTVGQFSIGINWDSGVIDRWSRPIEVNGMRVHHFTGGASHIDIRSIEVSVYIESLCREVKAYGPDNYRDFNYNDPNKLIRRFDNDWVTFKNGVTCSKTVRVVEGGEEQTVRAGEIIWGGKVYPISACTFKEVADSKITYSVPDNSAVAARGSVPVISAK